MDEEVLVFPGALLKQLGQFRGFSTATDAYLPTLLAAENLSYLPRSRAEDDPRFKQVVPYAVLRCGELIYSYERGKKGTETRLHQLLSLGVGGHISREDGAGGADPYQIGYARELEEEVHIDTTYVDQIVGMVYDDSTPVGSVHFGVVHLLTLAEPKVTFRDPALANARFLPLAEIREFRDRLESWSAYVLDHVLKEPG